MGVPNKYAVKAAGAWLGFFFVDPVAFGVTCLPEVCVGCVGVLSGCSLEKVYV